MALSAIIQPKKIGNRTYNKLSCFVTNYDLMGRNCSLYWYLSSLDEEGPIVEHGNYSVPYEILQKWGEDDSTIIKNLAENLSVTIVHIIN